MKRFTMALLALVLTLGVAQSSAAVRVVFMGDSITRLFGSNRPKFFSENEFSCKGADGQTTKTMLGRFQNDVINAKPEVVVIGAGTNDIAKNDGAYVLVEQIYANIVKMAEMAKEAGIKVVLTTTMPAEAYWFGKDGYTKPTIAVPRLNNMLMEYAANNDCGWIDYYSMFATPTGKFDERWSYDDCHPQEWTYDVIIETIMSVLEPMLNE